MLSERVEIEVGIAAGRSARAIAQRVGRPPSTISRELHLNGGRERYGAVAAHARAVAERARPRSSRFDADSVLAAHVTSRLEAKDSPMTISRELSAGVYSTPAAVSHETIYRAVYAQGRAGLRKGLHVHLHRRRPRRRHRRDAIEAQQQGPLGEFNLIGLRPPEADGRGEVGHLEGDLIVGAFNRSAIATVFDRASRYLWLADLPEGHGADAVLAALIELVERIPEPLRRTLTWDQGREMARHATLAATVGIDVFFAEPHSPWQRPTNENGNGLIRRYVGKGTNLNLHTANDLRRIEHRINTMPRRIHNWSTAHTVYHDAVALTG